MECTPEPMTTVNVWNHGGFDPEYPESFPWERVEPKELGEEALYMCRVIGNFPGNLVREIRGALCKIARETTIKVYF